MGWMKSPFRKRRTLSFWMIAPVVLLASTALVLWLDSEFPGAFADGDQAPRLVYYVLLLALVSAGVVAGVRLRIGTFLRYGAIWAGVFAVLLLGYSYRDHVYAVRDRLVGEFRPDAALTLSSGEVEIRRGMDGHFRLTAEVNGQPIRFLVDTGASLVVLTPADATRIGVDADRLQYSFPSRTANGEVATARLRLADLNAGPIRERDIPAAVIREGLPESLLGLSFLNRLSGYEVNRDRMILRP